MNDKSGRACNFHLDALHTYTSEEFLPGSVTLLPWENDETRHHCSSVRCLTETQTKCTFYETGNERNEIVLPQLTRRRPPDVTVNPRDVDLERFLETNFRAQKKKANTGF